MQPILALPDFFWSRRAIQESRLVAHVEQSKMESGLGETDITVICNIDGEKHALLIEDKIDAIALPEQHDRYVKRGQKGVANNEYAGFDVFIVGPER